MGKKSGPPVNSVRRDIPTRSKTIYLTNIGLTKIQAFADDQHISFSSAIEVLALFGLGEPAAVTLGPMVATTMERALEQAFMRLARMITFAAVEAGIANRMSTACAFWNLYELARRPGGEHLDEVLFSPDPQDETQQRARNLLSHLKELARGSSSARWCQVLKANGLAPADKGVLVDVNVEATCPEVRGPDAKTLKKRICLTDAGREKIQAFADSQHISFSSALEALALFGLGEPPALALAPMAVSVTQHAVEQSFARLAHLIAYTAVEVGIAARMSTLNMFGETYQLAQRAEDFELDAVLFGPNLADATQRRVRRLLNRLKERARIDSVVTMRHPPSLLDSVQAEAKTEGERDGDHPDEL